MKETINIIGADPAGLAAAIVLRKYEFPVKVFEMSSPAAGFELGSGIYINVALPEETAAFMRDFLVNPVIFLPLT